MEERLDQVQEETGLNKSEITRRGLHNQLNELSKEGKHQ